MENVEVTEKQKLMGTLLIITSTILWGINGNVGTFLFQNKEVNADHLTMMRLFFSGLVLLTYQLIRNRDDIRKMLSVRSNITRLLFFTFFGLLAMQYGYFQAVRYSNAATGTVLQSFAPFFIVVLIAIKERTRPSNRVIASLALAFGGAFLLVTHGRIDQLAVTPKAFFFGMLSSIGAVSYNLVPGPLQRKYSTISIMALAMFIAGASFGLVMRPFQNPIIVDAQSILGMLYVIFFGTLIPFTIFLMGSKYVGPQKASILTLLEPVAATAVAVVVVGVELKIQDYIGIAMVLLALLILSTPEKGTILDVKDG